PFRAYSKAIASAPATTSGPSSRETTASAPATTSGPSSRETTESGGQMIDTSTGENIWNLSGEPSIGEVMTYASSHTHTIIIDGKAYESTAAGGHAHGLYPHYHKFSIPPHAHEMDH